MKRKDRPQLEKQMSTESIQVSRQLIFNFRQICSPTGGASIVFAIIVMKICMMHIDCGEGACDQAGRVRAEPVTSERVLTR